MSGIKKLLFKPFCFIYVETCAQNHRKNSLFGYVFNIWLIIASYAYKSNIINNMRLNYLNMSILKFKQQVTFWNLKSV